MDDKRFFPVIDARETDTGYQVMVGIKLSSILKGELLFPGRDETSPGIPYVNPIHPDMLHHSREAFLYALSAWEKDVVIELHLTSIPDLVSRPRGRFDVHLFILVQGESVEKNNEQVMSRYMALMPLLFSCFPYLEFEPVSDLQELLNSYHPFKAWHAISIERHVETIELTTMLERQWISGFGQMKEKEKSGAATVNHRNPFSPTSDDGSKLINLLLLQLDPCKIIVRFRPNRLEPSVLHALEDTIRACETVLGSNHAQKISLNRQVSLVRDTVLLQIRQLKEACMDIGIFITALTNIDRSLAASLGRTITRGIYGDGTGVFSGGFSINDIDVKTVADAFFFPEDIPFSIPEAACALRFPVPPMDEQPGLPLKRFRTIMARIPQRAIPDHVSSIVLFHNEHFGLKQPVVLTDEDRMRHMFIIGQTGTGKSTLMARMILQDIRAGKGLAVIDPHGEMVDEILERMPMDRIKDVILFDMVDRERPLGFNILAWDTDEDRDLIIDSLYQSLDALYDLKTTGGPIFEKYFRGMLRLLMMDKHLEEYIPNILEFSMCFVNRDFRSFLKKNAKDPVIYDFVNEMEQISSTSSGSDLRIENISPYITSKLSRFISDKTLKMIIGQDKTSFDFSDVMNEGKILFIKLGKGRFGSTVSALLTNQLVTRFKIAAMKRGDIPPDKRRDFYLYVDESHNLPQDNFTELLSEARKYRLGLILSTQYTAQIGNRHDPNSLISGILGNVGTIVSYRLGQEDASNIGKIFLPFFSTRDIRELPNFHGYAATQINNQSVSPFNFISGRDETPKNMETAKAIIEHSRNTYGTNVIDVQTMIERRRTLWRRL